MARMLQWRAVESQMTRARRKRAMKKTALVSTLLLAAAAMPAVSQAEATANIGWVSDYIFRGILQAPTSAYAGVDYTSGGFYVGTWNAEVDTGLETDLYFGYSGGKDVTYKVGYTGYFYADNFDDTYNEINLGVGYGIFALDVAVGKYDSTPKQDYTFTSITLSPKKGPYYKVGGFSQDFSGSYFELGYTWSLADQGIDFSVIFDHSSDLAVDANGGENALVFGIKKNFTLKK
jgi:uncharacterized protein (TIGR02001 family)